MRSTTITKNQPNAHTCDTTIDVCGETPRSTDEEFVGEQHHHPRRATGNHCGDNSPANGVAVPWSADRAPAAAVKRHEARDENEAAEGDERHRVARDGVGPPRRARGADGGLR